MKRAKVGYESSKELKDLYNLHFDRWCSKYRLGSEELAQRCGVSVQYLGHVSRYGRIPGKPILILLALTLEVPDPQSWLRAAGIQDPWPFESGVGLRAVSASDSGFISMSVDLPRFTSAIREIVRSEMRPRTVGELLNGRPLRIGLNRGQSFLFGGTKPGVHSGFFPEIARLLALSLHCEIEFVDISHATFARSLATGEIDIFGPVYATPNRLGQALFTHPFGFVRLGALMRTQKADALLEIPTPKSLAELKKRDYILAVHEESMSHHFASGELGIPAERLLLCKTPEESIERLLLSGIPRPAHILLTDEPHATQIHGKNPAGTEILFARGSKKELPQYEDAIAVRSDWPVLVGAINEALSFLKRNGSIERLGHQELGALTGVQLVA